MTTLMFGKQAATYDKRDLLFAHYKTDVAITAAPVGFSHTNLLKNPWGMLGNDEYGDCAVAGPCHETMLWNAAAGKQVTFTTQNALNAYSAITGFTPDNPNSDQGCNVRDVLKYRAKTGLTDSTGNIHKIGAYVALEPGNWTELLDALNCFESVGIGIQVPSSAMTQFQNHKPWSVTAGAHIEGGHYIPVVTRPAKMMGGCVTWGAVQLFTEAFYAKYCDEAWAILSPEMLNGGKSLEGFDLATLQADLFSALNVPLCECHGVLMLWQKDARKTAGGYWRCREQRREYNKKRQAQRVEWNRVDYHNSPRRYLYNRRRELGAQRERIQEKLVQLKQEAEDLVLEPGPPKPEEAESHPARRVHFEAAA